jgi:hypothetical protein
VTPTKSRGLSSPVAHRVPAKETLELDLLEHSNNIPKKIREDTR